MSFKDIAAKIKPTLSPVLISCIIICYMSIGAGFFVLIEHNPQLNKRIFGAKTFLPIFNEFQLFCLNASSSKATDNTEIQVKLIGLLSKWSEVSTLYSLNTNIFTNIPNETNWSFYESLLFTFSLITTVGYGVVTPETFIGRLFCICYSVVGIPLCMIGIANIGKFMSSALLQIQKHSTHYWSHYYNKLKKLANKSARREKELESQLEEHPNEVVTLSPVTLFSTIFLYLMVGSVILPSYEQMDWFTACYFCFISITTVGFGDVVPQGNPCPTLMYLAIGLALTTMAIEMGAELLLKLHYLGRKFSNAKNAMVRFGGRKLTVNDIVRALGQKFNIPLWEIDKFTDNMDKFIEQTFVDKENGKLYPTAETTLLTTNPESVFGVVGEIDFADDLDDSYADL